jgi:hypothetical protein
MIILRCGAHHQHAVATWLQAVLTPPHACTACHCLRQSCATCNLETLASSGSCLPGSYLLTFSVANDDGLVATAQRRLVVYQSALLTSSFVLYEGLTNSSQVDAIVANAANASSAEGADVVALILSRLGIASAGLDAGDVQVLSASATQVDATNYSVAVNASIHVFSPVGVHRKDIQVAAAGAGAAAGGRRRLLVDAVATATGSASRAGRVLHAGQPPLAAVHAFLQLLDGDASCAGAGGMCTAADSNAAASAGRRLLQASADALQSSLQVVAGGLSSGLGAANVSSAVTTPPVDLQAVSCVPCIAACCLSCILHRMHLATAEVASFMLMCCLAALAGLPLCTHQQPAGHGPAAVSAQCHQHSYVWHAQRCIW